MERRTFLQQTLGLAALPVAGTANALAAPPAAPLRRRTLRLAHLTDIHVQSGRGAPEGMAAALRHAQSLEDPPEAILFGGDCIGDALGKPKAEVLEQWDLWNRILDRELRLPAYSCLGNHDIHGWKLRAAQPEVEADPMYGKDFALRRLGMASRHYTFDRGGWRFIVLDSMVYAEGRHGYAARLDEEQYAWLERTLGGTPAAMPVCVLSHIPILSAAVFLDGDLAKSGEWQVPGAWMHLDVARIKTLFHRHPNVRVCLSGHVHLVDDVTYLGVRYLCNGAVSGGWWKGPYQEFGPLYAVIDFHDDGTVERRMEGWGGALGAGA